MNEAPQRHQLGVKGMTCQHCVKVITQAIQAGDADATVTVDLPSGKVDVATTLPRESVVRAIEEEGYAVLG